MSTEFKFIASHFFDFSCLGDPLGEMPFSMIHAILGHRSLRSQSENSLDYFFNKVTETNGEMSDLLEFVRFGYGLQKVAISQGIRLFRRPTAFAVCRLHTI
jgi:hypothetical protein